MNKEDIMKMKKWKKVSKEEYDKFIEHYERENKIKLCDHSIYFCTPPSHNKYDFRINPFDSDGTICSIASHTEGWYSSEDDYRIVENVKEILNKIEGMDLKGE